MFILNLDRFRAKRKIEMRANENQIEPILECFYFHFNYFQSVLVTGMRSRVFTSYGTDECQLNVKIICTFDMNNGTCCLVAINKVN